MSLDLLREQIKQYPISHIISNYLSLQRKGTSLVSLCPFHNDSHPSMHVNDGKGMFKCFACGAGGDSIKFVMDYKKLDFIESLKELAQLLGLNFEEFQKEKKTNPKIKMAQRVLSVAQKIYLKSAQEQSSFLDFINKRKLTPEIVQKFQLGFAPAQNALTNYLLYQTGDLKDSAIESALEIQLIRRSQQQNGQYYDFFRERIMFPIFDPAGTLVGFSSRAIFDKQIPKYLNSVDSLVFNKGHILFAQNFAKAHIKTHDSLILVEGHMDAIMMHQHGFENCVATMGTALSEFTLKRLTHLTKNFYLAMDKDEAGWKAMVKINQDFMHQGILPRYIDFGKHKDPDDFLKNEGKLALMKIIEEAPSFIDRVLENIIPTSIPDSIDRKIDLLTKIMHALSPLGENLQALERIFRYARRLGLKSTEQALSGDYKLILENIKNRQKAPSVQQLKISQSERLAQKASEALESSPIKVLESGEKLLLKQLFTHPESLTQIEINEWLALILHDEVKRIVLWMSQIYFEVEDSELNSLIQDHLRLEDYSTEIMGLVTESLFKASGLKLNDKVLEKTMKDLNLRLKMDYLKASRKRLVSKQILAQDQKQIDELLNEIAKIDKEIFQLKNLPL